MVKISGFRFYLYSITHYAAFKMAENGTCIKLQIPLCWPAGHIMSDIDN